MSLAAWLSRWPQTTLAVMGIPARAGVGLEHGRLSLLQPEEERVAVALADHQDHHRPRTDAADADDLQGEVGEHIAVEKPPALVGHRCLDLRDGRLDDTIEVRHVDVLDQRSVLDPVCAATFSANRASEPRLVRARASTIFSEPPARAVGDSHDRFQRGDIDARVPDVEVPHSRVPAHLRPVRLDGARCARGVLAGEPGRAGRDDDARREPLHVPLEGAGSVSSKSFRSKTRLRSGVAKIPKFERWQSPQASTSIPLLGDEPRSAAITAADPRRNANGEAAMRP